MKRFAFLLLCLALPAWGAEPSQYYPATLIDADCADAYSAGNGDIQTSGAPDGRCDQNRNTLATTSVAITNNRTFGPFEFPKEGGTEGIIVHFDTDAIAGGDVKVCILEDLLHEAGQQKYVFCSVAFSTAVDNLLLMADVGAAITSLTVGHLYTSSYELIMPRRFYLQLQMVTATSWSGSMSWQFTQ